MAAQPEPQGLCSQDSKDADGELERPRSPSSRWLVCAECSMPLARSEELLDEPLAHAEQIWSYELDVLDRDRRCYLASTMSERFDLVRVEPGLMNRSIEVTGTTDIQNEWFPGFAKSTAICAKCCAHVGWAFSDDTSAEKAEKEACPKGEEEEAAAVEPCFFGLILTKMREREVHDEDVDTVLADVAAKLDDQRSTRAKFMDLLRTDGEDHPLVRVLDAFLYTFHNGGGHSIVEELLEASGREANSHDELPAVDGTSEIFGHGGVFAPHAGST